MLRGLSSSATAGFTPRSSALTLSPCTWISGADTVQAGEPLLAPAGSAFAAGVGTAAAAPAGVVGGVLDGARSRRFRRPASLIHALMSPPLSSTFATLT